MIEGKLSEEEKEKILRIVRKFKRMGENAAHRRKERAERRKNVRKTFQSDISYNGYTSVNMNEPYPIRFPSRRNAR